MTKKRLLCLLAAVGFLAVLCVFLMLVLPSVNLPQTPPSSAETTVETTTAATTEETTVPAETEPVPLTFGYAGDYLTCLSAPSVLGIDVSRYQGNIDWQKVKQAGVEFVIIRAAGRGYGNSGQLYEDSIAQENYRGAIAAGLKVGAYIFSQAISEEEAREEARYLLEITRDWQLEMPLVFDWECLAEDYRTMGVDARRLTDYTLAFCQEIEAAGRTPMIYYNPDQSYKQMYLEELSEYDLWLAMYQDTLEYPYEVSFWQYTNEGSVPGISGNVDINLYFPEESA